MDLNGAVSPPVFNASFGPQSASSSDLDDHSFVVLNRESAGDTNSLEADLGAATATMQTSNPLLSCVSSFGLPSDFQQQIDTLVDENSELRATLDQTNVALRQTATATMQTSNPVSNAFSNHFSVVPNVSTLPNGELPSRVSSFGLPSDFQQQIDTLVDENSELRATLDQTNVALRQTMLTLSQWGNEIEQLREDHKEKFQDTRSLVLRLKKEKAEMRAELEELRGKKVSSEDKTQSKTIIENLTAQLKESKAAHHSEIEKNKSYVEELSLLKEDLSKTRRQLEQIQSLKENNQSQLETILEENNKLKADIVNLSAVERHLQNYQVEQVKGFVLRIDELTAKLMSSEEELREARSEILVLKSAKGEVDSERDSSSTNEEALVNVQMTVDRLRSRIDDMTSQIVELTQKCETLERKNLLLIQENEKIQSQKDEAVAILQAQVEVYRSDFNAERNCRELLAGEKEKLAEDLRRVHRRYLELQEQQDRMGNHAFPGNERREVNVDEVQQPDEISQQPSAVFNCPICGMAFRTVQFVDDHIDGCLSNNTGASLGS